MHVLVIFGAAVWPGGQASPTLARRVDAAAKAFLSGGYDLVVPSGGIGRHSPSEAQVMADLLARAGVPESSIRLEDQATSTFETAEFVGRMMAADPLTRFTLVSDSYHILRCKIAFAAFGHLCGHVTTAGATPPPRWQVQARQWLREGFAVPVYLLKLPAVVVRNRRTR